MKAMKRHVTAPVVHASMVIFGASGLMLVALAPYHAHIPAFGRRREDVGERAADCGYL